MYEHWIHLPLPVLQSTSSESTQSFPKAKHPGSLCFLSALNILWAHRPKIGTNLCLVLSAPSVSRGIFVLRGCILCRFQIKYFPYFGFGLCAQHHTQIIWFTAPWTCGWHELICVSIVCVLDSVTFQLCIILENIRVQCSLGIISQYALWCHLLKQLLYYVTTSWHFTYGLSR